MGKFLLLAFRNVFRNRRRTLMTLLMVGGGVAGLLLVGGFFALMFWGLRENTIHNGLGHLQIFTAEHFQPRRNARARHRHRQLAPGCRFHLQRRPCARRRAPHRVLRNALERRKVRQSSWAAPSIRLPNDSLGFTPRLAAGRDLDAKPGGEIEALIGAGVARSMNVKVGDGLTILAVTADGALNGIDVQVVGIVNTGFKEMDDRYLRITLPSAQRLLQSDRVTNLVVGLDATENTDEVAAALAPRLSGLPQQLILKKWIDLAAYYKQVRSLFSGIFVFLGVIVFFMVLMSSVNTLLMTMFERTREIGTMLAMGTPRSWIMALFVLEATLLGVLGAIAGVAGGNLLGLLLNHAGIHLPPPPGTTVPMAFRVLLVPSLMIGSSILVVVSLALASILPAVRASRLQIAEALAHV